LLSAGHAVRAPKFLREAVLSDLLDAANRAEVLVAVFAAVIIVAALTVRLARRLARWQQDDATA
jgi:hypothetical protein